MHTHIEIKKMEVEILKDEEEEEVAPCTGVVLQGWKSLDNALLSLHNNLAACICHLVRESVQKQVLKGKTGESRDGAQADLDALIDLLSPQRALQSGACIHPWSLRIVYTGMQISPGLAEGGMGRVDGGRSYTCCNGHAQNIYVMSPRGHRLASCSNLNRYPHTHSHWVMMSYVYIYSMQYIPMDNVPHTFKHTHGLCAQGSAACP